ncbi:MAG TPA: hypothetical protein VGG46_07950 [Terriglobales bacterium]
MTNKSARGNFGGVMGPDKVLGEGIHLSQALCTTPEVHQEEILEHLDQILSHPLFRNSRRYAAVLRYVVEHTLQGNEAPMKERTIGIEVFGRTPDYDTANDHVVRSAMSEVRRRLAQYYSESGSGSEVRIELQPGSYVPHFSRVEASGSEHGIASDATAPANGIAVLPLLTAASHPRIRLRIVLLGIVSLVAMVAILLVRPYWNDPLRTFWAPVFSAQGPVLLCVGTLGEGRQSAGGTEDTKPPVTLSDFHSSDTQLVHISDAITLAELSRLLGQHNKITRLASQSEANFADLQNGPAILVGLKNNDWTERLISNLRFTVGQDSQRRVMLIRDRDNPAKHDWAINYSEPYLDITKDYALILRVRDPKTDQVVVVAAGLSVFGTSAAGKFLTDPDDMKKLAAIAPKDWGNKNMEIVLSTVVIRGTAGHGTIIASQFW